MKGSGAIPNQPNIHPRLGGGEDSKEESTTSNASTTAGELIDPYGEKIHNNANFYKKNIRGRNKYITILENPATPNMGS